MIRSKDFFEPRLPFPVRTVEVRGGEIEVYVIPDNQRAAVLKELFPYIPVPSLEEEMYDLPAEKKFLVKDFCVTREGGMNMLVSPFYFESGGTVIDWVPADFED